MKHKNYFLNKFHSYFSILFLAVTLMVSGDVWGDNITYAGTEKFYFDKASNTGWGSVVANDNNTYLEFSTNGSGGKRSSKAVWYEDPYLVVTAPAGTYNQVRIIRTDKNNDNSVWNTFSWINLQTGKNRILNGGGLDYYEETPCDNPKPSTNYYMAGQGFPNISWDRQSITMKWDCDKAVYYYTFTNLAADNSMTYRFKLNPSTVDDWSQQLNSDNIDNNYKDYANLTLKSDNDDKRITFDLAVKSNVTIYTKDGKVWASQEEAGDPLSSNDYYLRGDLWQNSGGDGWESSTSKTPKFTKNNSNTKATMWYVMPSGLKLGRFEFYEGSTVQSPSNFWGSSTGLDNVQTSGDKKTFTCPSSPKLLSFSYTAANKLVVTATAPELKSGFKVKYRKSGDSNWTEVALDANGEATLSNLQNSSKYYLIITDGGTLHAINWYGGLYFDMTNSNVAFDNKIDYYKSVTLGANYPISSIAEPNGVFNITGGNTDVKVKFDGGSIKLTKVATTKYIVSFDSKEGSSVASQEVTSGGFATKPTPDPTKDGYNFMGWSETDGGSVVDVTTIAITENKTFYAKWEELKCPSYSFHNGPESGDWIIPLCFEQVGSTSEWKIENFVIDGTKPKFYVGYQGSFYNDKLGKNQQSRSKNKTLSEAMSFAQTQNNDGPKVGNATGAVGTLRIYDDSDWDNLMCAFIPNGYGLMYGANATENSIALKATAVGTVFMTDDVTLTADMLKTDGSYKYQVGLATATAGQYVACDNSEKANMGSMGSYVTGDDWQGNVSTYAAGNKGKFRIWIDKTNKNWLCHFVPYWTLKYDLNGESGTEPQGAEVFSEASQQDRTITITSTIPQATHKVFDGWYTQATGGDKETGSIELTKHTTLFAHWTDAPQWTVSFDSDGGSAVASQTVWNGETATEPSPAPTKTDLSLKEWQLNGVKYDFSTPVTANITLKAIWSDVCDMTDVKYAEPTVAQMTANNLFDEDDNTEPAQLTKCQIQVGGSNYKAYVDPSDENIKHGTGSTDYYYWYQIPTGSKASCGRDMYLYRNAGNNKYLRKKNTGATNKNWGWDYVITSDYSANDARFQWYFKDSNAARLVCNETTNSNSTGYSKYEMFLHRKSIESSPVSTYLVCGSSDGNQGDDELTTTIVNSSTVDNPNYLKEKVEQGGKTYYRFANNAVVSTILPKALKAEDKITVYYYATAATTAELRINGTKVADITITSAGANTYVYTAVAGDAGQTAVAVASNSTSFLMAQIEVARPTPTSPRASNLAWDTDLSAGVTRMVDAGAFTHTATAKGAGAITYSSSNEDVATVAANGTVTPVAAGTTVIKATLEQDGCYEGKEITYNVTLTDLPKPTITFTTLPSDAPQGSVQTVVATTDGGANFDVTVKSGSGYTITSKTIEDNICTMVLNIGADATDIVLTASTERISGVVSQHAVDGTLTVSECIPNGSDIFSFTMAGSAATSGQIATGLVGGTVDQTALGTKGTDDNPATVAIKKLKFNNQFVTDVNATAQITTGKSDHSDEWYMLPAGTYDNKQMYYLKNVATGQYIYKDKSFFYGPNAGWKYYAVRTSSTNAQTDIYKWMEVPKDNVKRFANRESYVSNDYEHTHNMRPCVTEAANDWKTPYVGAGLSGHQGNTEWNSELVEVQSSAANPDMFKSVQYNSKTYYIVSSEGAITINCAIKEGDKIRIDTYDRKTEQANVVEITAQSDMSSYVYTTTNEYLCVAGITIFRPKYGEYATPTLTWDTDLSEPQLVDLNNGGVAATHTATSNVATIKTIAYSSNNSYITVDATTGAVSVNAKTPDHEEATITATLPAVGCYDEATTTYTILVKNVQEGSLQDAIDDIEDGGTLTLDWDYIGSDAEIDNKKMTIDAGGHKIGNLTITTTGDLTLSSAMTANDFVIESSQVEPVSGQLKGADKLTVAGSAYMDLSFGAEAVTAGWYAFTVPFAVSSTGGVYNANTGAKLTNETDYAIMHYQGDVRAQGQYGWIKTHKKGGVMQPGTLYIIAFGDTEYNKIRFKKASGALSTNTVAVHQYGGGTETDNGWNGVGNPSLAYGNATNTGGAEKAQFLDHASNAFVISEQEITDQTYVVSSAFFIQANTDDNMTFTVPDNIGELMAPRRASANKEFMLELSQGAQFQDRLYLSVSEEAKDEYEIGHDLVKMSAVNGNATVAQMAIEGYDMNLCDAEFPMSEEVLFPLVLSAPKAGEYTLSVQRACAEQELFVVNDGVVVWDLKQGDYTLDLQKGTTYDYSLMLQAGERTMPTGTDVIRSANGVQKIILRQELRIIRDGKMFNAQGIEL